jgi:hypothetical protein
MAPAAELLRVERTHRRRQSIVLHPIELGAEVRTVAGPGEVDQPRNRRDLRVAMRFEPVARTAQHQPASKRALPERQGVVAQHRAEQLPIPGLDRRAEPLDDQRRQARADDVVLEPAPCLERSLWRKGAERRVEVLLVFVGVVEPLRRRHGVEEERVQLRRQDVRHDHMRAWRRLQPCGEHRLTHVCVDGGQLGDRTSSHAVAQSVTLPAQTGRRSSGSIFISSVIASRVGPTRNW